MFSLENCGLYSKETPRYAKNFTLNWRDIPVIMGAGPMFSDDTPVRSYQLWQRMWIDPTHFSMAKHEYARSLRLLWEDLDAFHQAFLHESECCLHVYRLLYKEYGVSALFMVLQAYFVHYPQHRETRKESLRLIRRIFGKERFFVYCEELGFLQENTGKLYDAIRKQYTGLHFQKRFLAFCHAMRIVLPYRGAFCQALWRAGFARYIEYFIGYMQSSSLTQPEKQFRRVHQSLLSLLLARYDGKGCDLWPETQGQWVHTFFRVYAYYAFYKPSSFELLCLAVLMQTFVGENWQEKYPEIVHVFQLLEKGQIQHKHPLIAFIHAVLPVYLQFCVPERIRAFLRHWEVRSVYWAQCMRAQQWKIQAIYLPMHIQTMRKEYAFVMDAARKAGVISLIRWYKDETNNRILIVGTLLDTWEFFDSTHNGALYLFEKGSLCATEIRSYCQTKKMGHIHCVANNNMGFQRLSIKCNMLAFYKERMGMSEKTLS